MKAAHWPFKCLLKIAVHLLEIQFSQWAGGENSAVLQQFLFKLEFPTTYLCVSNDSCNHVLNLALYP